MLRVLEIDKVLKKGFTVSVSYLQTTFNGKSIQKTQIRMVTKSLMKVANKRGLPLQT